MEKYADRKLSPCCQFFISGFVGLLTDPFMCRRLSFHTNALPQPSLRAMAAHPMTGFHRTRGFPAWKQYFRNTATFGILPHDHNIKLIDCKSCDRFFPCPGFSPDSLVQRTSMRVQGLPAKPFASPASVWVAHVPQKP